MTRIRLGVSSCLLGNRVRYDGGHKLDPFLRAALGPSVTWVPVCPEVESGLPVPREALVLLGEGDATRVVGRASGTDHTARLLDFARRRLGELAEAGLDGFVFKSRSPSCAAPGPGLFARAFGERFAELPVEDEERLRDPRVRERFLERARAHARRRTRRGAVPA